MESGVVMLNGVEVVGQDDYWVGYNESDGDYEGWASRSVLLEEDNRVMVTGTRYEVGFERPGLSYKNEDTIQVGKYDPETKEFVKTL